MQETMYEGIKDWKHMKKRNLELNKNPSKNFFRADSEKMC